MKNLKDILLESILSDDTDLGNRNVIKDLKLDYDDDWEEDTGYKIEDLKEVLYMFVFNEFNLSEYTDKVSKHLMSNEYGVTDDSSYMACAKWLIYSFDDKVAIGAEPVSRRKTGVLEYLADTKALEKYCSAFTIEFNKRLKTKQLSKNIIDLFK